MKQTISTLQLRQKMGEILDRVALRQDRFLVVRKGRPMAAVVPAERLDQMARAARMQLMTIMDRQEEPILSQEEADSLADEAKHASRPRVRGNVE